MNVSFIVPCRDKAPFVEDCVRSVLMQTYAPFEIVLSDQGSTDGTLAILEQLAAEYNGPNEVRVLRCPDTELRGMAGLNRHYAWLHQRISGDIVIACSADDTVYPDRVTHTVEAFREFNPSYVGTGLQYERPDGSVIGETDFPKRASRRIGMAEAIEHDIGSSASGAWSRDLWERHGPLQGIESQDVVLPMMAMVERGYYYVDEVLHRYVAHADPANTGMEGQMRAASGSPEMLRLVEVNNFHHAYNWLALWRRMKPFLAALAEADRKALLDRVMDRCRGWSDAR